MSTLLDYFTQDQHARTLAWYARGENVSVTDDMIHELCEISMAAGKVNARLCLHQGAEDGFHQMLILEWRGKSFPAHRHPAKSEGYHLMRGAMYLHLYDDNGMEYPEGIRISMESPIARVGPNTFHGLEVITPYAIYLESKPGPFIRDTDKIMAPWL